MKPWWATLLRQQRAEQFEAISGTSASVVLPISDELMSDLISKRLPSAVRELEVKALAANHLSIAVRLRSPAWLPKINLKVGIHQQPHFPDTPVLVLRFLSHATLASLVGPASRFFGTLPSWIQLEGDLVRVDFAELARDYDATDLLTYVRELKITTRKGAAVLTVDARIP